MGWQYDCFGFSPSSSICDARVHGHGMNMTFGQLLRRWDLPGCRLVFCDLWGTQKVVALHTDFNTNQTHLASEASERKVIVCYSNLNENQAHLASEASELKVVVVHTNLNTDQANLALEA